MKPTRLPVLLLLLLAAACGTPDDAAPGPAAHGGAQTDTLPPDPVRGDARVEAVRGKLEQAERDAAERSREALEAAEPR